MHQMSFGGRAPPGPAGGAYSAPPDPLDALKLLAPSAFEDRAFRFFFSPIRTLIIYHTTPWVYCHTACGKWKFKFATNYKRRVRWNETSCHKVWQTTLLVKVYNSCLKCPPFARTYAQRPLRHSSTASSMTLWSTTCRYVQQTLLRFVNAVQLRLMHSLLDVTLYLVIDRIKVGAIRRPQIWMNESGCWLLKKSHSVACPVCRCAV